MIKGGYILQPRIIDQSEAMNFNPTTRELWLFLLRRANHKDNGKFKRGQCFLSLNDMQNGLSWYSGYRKNTYSKPQLTKAIRRLTESNMIETTKEIRGLTITICEYDYYQDPKNYEGNDKESTGEVDGSKGGRAINKNEKNKKERVLPLVFLSVDEIKKLKEKFGSAYQWALDELESYKQRSGTKYKSDYHAILKWVLEKAEKEGIIKKPSTLTSSDKKISTDPKDYFPES